MNKKELYCKVDRVEVIEKGTYKKIPYYITTVGRHPNAYIADVKEYGQEWAENQINCHGGVTFYNYPMWNKDDEYEYIGWDYGHCTDYFNSYSNSKEMMMINKGKKKWTLEEIRSEVVEVIEEYILKGE